MGIEVLLADDHPLLLQGTQTYLEKLNFKVVAAVNNGHLAYQNILKKRPTIAILDFDMPDLNGIEIAKLCAKDAELNTKIIILTLYKEEAIVNEIGKSIEGYLLKDDALLELDACIKEVTKGNSYISKNIHNSAVLPSHKGLMGSLTTTEIKILRYLERGLSSSEIAESLFISKRTVEKHRSNIIQKLGLKSTQNALVLWVQRNSQLL